MNDSLLDIEKSLEYSFLYDNDTDSLHVLLSIFDHWHRYKNMCPKYILMKKLNTALKRTLTDRRDREYIIRAIKKLINDDINRFELAVTMDVYSKGYEDAESVDRLERIALENFTDDELHNKKILFHNVKSGKAIGLQSRLYHNLKVEQDDFKQLKRLSSMYCKKVLKHKVYQINSYLDKQVVLNFDDLSQLKLEENNLTIKELNHIYNKLSQYLYNNITRVYKEAYWNGVNDAVLERYSR